MQIKQPFYCSVLHVNLLLFVKYIESRTIITIISFSITLHRIRNNYLQLLTKMILGELFYSITSIFSVSVFPLASFVVQTTAPFDSCARTYVPECSHFWVEKPSYHNTLVLLTKVLCNRCFRKRIGS